MSVFSFALQQHSFSNTYSGLYHLSTLNVPTITNVMPEAHLLSPNQKRIVAAGGTALASAFLFATAFFLFVMLRRFVGTFQDVFLPLAIAAILATLLRPIIIYCEAKTRLTRVQGIILLYVLVLLIIGLFAMLLIPLILTQGTEFIEQAPQLRDNILDFIKNSSPGLWEWLQAQLGESPDKYLKSLAIDHSDSLKNALSHLQSTVGSIGGFFGSTFGKVAAYSIIPVYLFFILNGDRDIWKDIEKQLNFLPDERREDLVFLGRQFSDILIAFFRGQIIIGFLLGVVLAIGFGIVGLKFGIALGLILGLLNIIPYLGTMLGIITVLPLAYFQDSGGSTLIILCAAVFAIGQLLTDYVFTPRIMGKKTGMGPMLLIFSVFFWGAALGGILGMVLAIPLTAFFLVFWRLAREKYLPALIAERSQAQLEASTE
jgi:predicted PurR-regulated permease PerM